MCSPFVDPETECNLEGSSLPRWINVSEMNFKLAAIAAPSATMKLTASLLVDAWWSSAMTDASFAYRRFWLPSGAHGDVMPKTRKRYAIEIARLLSFSCVFLKADPQSFEQADVPRLTAILKDLILCPMTDISQFGSSFLGQFLLLVYLNASSTDSISRCLSPAALRAICAAVKFFYLCITTFSFLLQRDVIKLRHESSPAISTDVEDVGIPLRSQAAVSIKHALDAFYDTFHNDCYQYAHVCRLSSDCARATMTEPLIPRMRFTDLLKTVVEMDGRSLSVENLGKLCQNLMDQAVSCLQILMRGHDPRAMIATVTELLETNQLEDSMISHGVSKLFAQSNLPTSLKHKYELFKRSWDQADGGEPFGDPTLWIERDATVQAQMLHWLSWMQTAQRLQYLFFVLILVTGGSPKRASELSQARLDSSGPSSWEQRTMAIAYGTISLTDAYSKTSSQSQSGVVTRHFLPRAVAALVLVYVSSLRNIEGCAAAGMKRMSGVDSASPEETAKIRKTYGSMMWVNNGRRSTSARLTNSFCAIFRELMGQDVGIRAYRQMATALMESSGLNLQNLKQVASDGLTQGSGHSAATRARSYGRVYADSSIAQLFHAAEASSLWHTLLGFEALLKSTIKVRRLVSEGLLYPALNVLAYEWLAGGRWGCAVSDSANSTGLTNSVLVVVHIRT